MTIEELEAVQLPVLDFVTVSADAGTKVASTVKFEIMFTVIGVSRPPLHPAKREPAFGVAVNLTAALVVYLFWQLVPVQVEFTLLWLGVLLPGGATVT